MPPIEVGSTRAISAANAKIARQASEGALTSATAPAASPAANPAVVAGAAVATSEALNAGSAPVDADRVSQIRKAVESGEYPLVPARIADAMIAAGMFLRSAKA
jgi:negative regulator of flagellin synthesis FlgM